jgi:hypothetical protein
VTWPSLAFSMRYRAAELIRYTSNRWHGTFETVALTISEVPFFFTALG